MTLDEVSLLLLGRNYNSAAQILYSSFQGIPYASGHHRTTNIEGLLAVGPDMAKILTVLALRKAGLNSIWFYLHDNMVQAIQLEYLLRF
jgi:hypothetical protein